MRNETVTLGDPSSHLPISEFSLPLDPHIRVEGLIEVKRHSKHVKGSFAIVLITAPMDEAEGVARALLERKLASCVNILRGVESIYWWRGKVESSGEAMLVVKTRLDLIEEIERVLGEVHSYEVPELIALPIIGGSEEYIAWLESTLKQPSKTYPYK